MSNLFRQRGQILIIYLSTLFVGGASLAVGVLATGSPIKDIQKNVKIHVSDKARQESTLALLEQWEDQAKEQKKVYKQQRETLLDLIKAHDSDKTEFNSTINDILAVDEDTSRRVLDIQYELRQHMTADEWAKVFESGK